MKNHLDIVQSVYDQWGRQAVKANLAGFCAAVAVACNAADGTDQWGLNGKRGTDEVSGDIVHLFGVGLVDILSDSDGACTPIWSPIEGQYGVLPNMGKWLKANVVAPMPLPTPGNTAPPVITPAPAPLPVFPFVTKSATNSESRVASRPSR